MNIGAMIFATDQTIKVTRLAPELEARGFESLWIPEKTHLPASRSTPWPGGELPPWYKRTSDPFITLAAALSVTKNLRLGTGVALLAVRDPVITAKEVATLDWLSDGRFEFGIGYGWNVEELATHGVAIADAPAIMEDKLALMRALWRNDIGSHRGPHVNVEPSWSWPKPAQSGGPPVHLGARASKRAFGDIARYADGWLPIEGYGQIVSQIPRLRQAFAEADRNPSSAQISVFSSSGDPATVAEYRDHGINRVVVSLPATDEAAVLRALDHHCAQLAEYFQEGRTR